MFEVGFSEIAVIAVIALIVLGPERLPKAARMAGTFLRKARQSFESLKLEVERELEADELKKQFAHIAAAPAALANALQQPLAEAKAALVDSGHAAKAALEQNVDAVMQSIKAPLPDTTLSDQLDAPQSAGHEQAVQLSKESDKAGPNILPSTSEPRSP